MHSLYNDFFALLEKRDKDQCVRFCLDHLSNRTLDVVTLYEQILGPALNNPSYGTAEGQVTIWEEHSRTSIVRTIIESCYPYVVKERDDSYHATLQGTALVLCPSEEAHEIGARMIADFFTLTGFEVTYIGASTPGEQLVDAVEYFRPDYVAISVTNAYNLLATKKVVTQLKALKTTLPFTMILGGRACQTNHSSCGRMGVDLILSTFDDIRRISERGTDAAV